jgi:hypothetical protein
VRKVKRPYVGAPPKYPERERHMATTLRGASKSRRIELAVDRVLNGGWTQAEAARWAGLNVGTINRHIARIRLEQADADERSSQARVERAGVEVANESRRVPPIGEFVRKYFDGFKCWNCVSRYGEPVRHEIPGFHDEIMTRMADPQEKRLLVNVPPEHSKTTNGTVFTGIYDIVRDPNIQMAIISAGEDLARDIVGQMQMFLEDRVIYDDCTANLIDDFGPFNDGHTTWTQKQFVIVGRRSVEKDPTVRAFGINSKIYGRRLHRIICDDIADQDNSDTVEKVDKMFRKVTAILDSRVGGNGRLHVVGTRVNPNDVYKHLMDLSGYTVLRHPCILSYDDETTLWPDHIDFAEAMKRKARTTPELFELLYQNADTMGEGALFTREHLERCHDDRVLGELPRATSVDLVIGVDPAGHGKQAGYTAMVLLGIERTTGRRYLVDLVNQRSMTQPQMQAQIFDWVSRYRVRSVRYEAVALQAQIFETAEFRRHLTAHQTRMDAHRTHSKSGAGGKWDTGWGVEAMSPTFHNSMVGLPHGDAKTKRAVGELEEQLMRFPMQGAPTDLMMAYWIAETGCRLLFERGATQNFGYRLRADPIPREMAARRRVHSRGDTRAPTAQDFGMTRGPAAPVRLANMERVWEQGT